MNINHQSVLRNEVVDLLRQSLGTNDLVIDGTLGRGGHFFALLKYFNNLVAMDADMQSIEFAKSKLIKQKFKKENEYYKKDNKCVWLKNMNFTNIANFAKKNNLFPCAVLLDLGISTYQIKNGKRGFSFLSLDETLDMRIDQNSTNVKASDLLNVLSKKELQSMFFSLAGEMRAANYAKRIVSYRESKNILTVKDLLEALKINTLLKYKIHPATKVFMALRIAVNSEHTNLKFILQELFDYISKGAKLLIITFHSLESKAVKDYCKNNNLNYKKFFPTEDEINLNKSSRSATLFFIKK